MPKAKSTGRRLKRTKENRNKKKESEFIKSFRTDGEFMSRTYVRQIESKGNPKCKHEWVDRIIKHWWRVGFYIYCKNCGAWKEII